MRRRPRVQDLRSPSDVPARGARRDRGRRRSRRWKARRKSRPRRAAATTKTSASRPRQDDPSTRLVRRAHAPAVLAQRDGEGTLRPEQQLAHLVLLEEVPPPGTKANDRAVVVEHAAEVGD